MNWNEYKILSEKTLSLNFFNDDSKLELMLHAVIGILTEMDEILDNYQSSIDIINIKEEVGDITWYLAIIGRLYNMSFPIDLPVLSEDPMKTSISIIKYSCKLLDMLKKKLFYNKIIDENSFRETSTILMILIHSYMKYYNIDIRESFDVNIAKLKARYGEKFTTDKAINRDLEKERKILENAKEESSEDELEKLTSKYKTLEEEYKNRKVFEEEDLVSDPTFGRDELVNTGSLYLDGNSVSNRRTGGIFPNNSDMYLD